MRLSRLQLGLGVGLVIGLMIGLGWFFADAQDSAARRGPKPLAQPTAPPVPAVSDSALDLQSRVLDSSRGLEQRTQDLKALVLESSDSGLVLELLDSVDPQDPQRMQMRAMLISALARHPHDPRARERLIGLVQPGASRDDRLLAVSTLGSVSGSPPWCGRALRALVSDADAQVRERATGILERSERR